MNRLDRDRMFVAVMETGSFAAAARRMGTSSGQASKLVARRLCPSRVLVVAAPEYLARRGTPARPADLAGHDCIIDSNFRDPQDWRFAGSASGPGVVAVAGRIRFNNAKACLCAAEAGLGIARLPDFVASESLRAGRLREALADHADVPMGVFALYPPGRHLAVKVRVLVDFLAAWFRDRRFHDPGGWDAAADAAEAGGTGAAGETGNRGKDPGD